ncbi:MAG: hypothetical protein GXP58_10230 [Deltaproteobacteria bacterium]|nr:hypothetical protein [Deltaproteobacteria bacterium]
MKRKLPRLTILARTALNNAVAKVIEEHRRTGAPVALWQNGKVALIHPDRLPVHRPKESRQLSGKKSRQH